jgi:hypothetical protein
MKRPVERKEPSAAASETREAAVASQRSEPPLTAARLAAGRSGAAMTAQAISESVVIRDGKKRTPKQRPPKQSKLAPLPEATIAAAIQLANWRIGRYADDENATQCLADACELHGVEPQMSPVVDQIAVAIASRVQAHAAAAAIAVEKHVVNLRRYLGEAEAEKLIAELRRGMGGGA